MAPVLQVPLAPVPVAASCTKPPWQNVIGPAARMDGWPGRAFTRTTIGWLTALVQPEAMAWMVMLAACLSVMLRQAASTP